MPVPIRVLFDPPVDWAYIYLRDIEPGGFARTVTVPEVPGDIILDFDREWRLIGIEVMPASRVLPTELLERAERVERLEPPTNRE